jgi:ubiquinone/menaquinone biosynthesis C-methylase UbiE
MSIGGRIFACAYDRMMVGVEAAGLGADRERVLAGAHGHVLEIGGGSGANLAKYGPEVESLTVTDPEPPMIKRLRRRVDGSGGDRATTTVLRAPAEDLPFEADTFDIAVSTLVLCTVDDQPRALRELRRVLRPGGRLLFIEHVRSPDAELARRQDRLNGLNRVFGHGCNCNRPTLDVMRDTGFDVDDVTWTSLPRSPSVVRPLVIGSAVAPTSVGYPTSR